jgi:hypothetical protein
MEIAIEKEEEGQKAQTETSQETYYIPQAVIHTGSFVGDSLGGLHIHLSSEFNEFLVFTLLDIDGNIQGGLVISLGVFQEIHSRMWITSRSRGPSNLGVTFQILT